MKIKILGWAVLLTTAISLIVTHQAEPRRRRRPPAAPTQTVAIPPVLVNRSFTVSQLFDLINTGNPARTSDFLILTAQGGSAGARNSGYDWAPHAAQTVSLKQDPNRIAVLTKNKCFIDKQTQANYYNSMLWFTIPEIPNVAFYIIDPNPGRAVRAGNTIRSPASDIMARWYAILVQRGFIRQ